MDLQGKKITKATVKKFIRENLDSGKLYIKIRSKFSGMTDCVENIENNGFAIAEKTEKNLEYTLGVSGAWFVNGSRDSFEYIFKDGFHIIEVYNCCGCFQLAVKV